VQLSKVQQHPTKKYFGTLSSCPDSCGLVYMPLDRDLRSSALKSKGSYLSRLRRLFLEVEIHYESSAQSASTLLRLWHACFVARRWSSSLEIFTLRMASDIYCFPKAKNVVCDRVIVSCVRHPLRSILHRFGCILIRLLCRCAFAHFNLLSVADFIQKWEQYSNTVSSCDTLLGVYTDVKEMHIGMMQFLLWMLLLLLWRGAQ
jgi:hypothetical protein